MVGYIVALILVRVAQDVHWLLLARHETQHITPTHHYGQDAFVIDPFAARMTSHTVRTGLVVNNCMFSRNLVTIFNNVTIYIESNTWDSLFKNIFY